MIGILINFARIRCYFWNETSHATTESFPTRLYLLVIRICDSLHTRTSTLDKSKRHRCVVIVSSLTTTRFGCYESERSNVYRYDEKLNDINNKISCQLLSDTVSTLYYITSVLYYFAIIQSVVNTKHTQLCRIETTTGQQLPTVKMRIHKTMLQSKSIAKLSEESSLTTFDQCIIIDPGGPPPKHSRSIASCLCMASC